MGLLVGVLISVGLGLVLSTTPFGYALVNASYDLPFRARPFIEPTGFVLVYLDDTSHEVLHQPYTTAWNRALYTRLIKRLTAEHAKEVVIDVVFSDNIDPATDQELSAAMAENGNVVLCSDWIIGSWGVGGKPAGKKFKDPNPLFNQSAADSGVTTLFPDTGEYVRKYKPAIDDPDYPGGKRSSEAWAAALLVKPSFNENTNLRNSSFWINYYEPQEDLPAVSFYKAIATNDPDVPPGYFSNKVVFVGQKVLTYFTGQRKDEYSTPFSYLGNTWCSGVTIHALACMNLLRGDYLRRSPYLTERMVIILFGILFGAGFVLARPMMATIVAILSCFPIVSADYFLFDRYYYWFPWLIVVAAQIPVALAWGVAFNSVQLYVEKVLVEQSLSFYLSKKLVKKFAKDPKLREPGAENKLLTILFSDIAGFTTISEGMHPDELARMMQEYFESAVGGCIFPNDGTVIKFIGDAIFAVWNAPDLQADHAYLGCDAALRFRALKSQEVNGRALITRIGVHTGVAKVGNFGSAQRFDYTAMGESINLAARMEGLNKYLGTRVLITGETHKEAGPRLLTRYMGLFRLKGFEKSVVVHELFGRAGQDEDGSTELRRRFAGALDHFIKRDFARAESAFQEILGTHPEDGPSLFYLEQIAELRVGQLPPDWKGEITLKEK